MRNNSLEKFLSAPSNNERANQIAVTHPSRSLTYAELEYQVKQLETILAEVGVRTGDVVGVFVGDTVDWVICIVAAMRLRTAFIPLDPNDVSECGRLLKKAEPQGILGSPEALLWVKQYTARSFPLHKINEDVSLGILDLPRRDKLDEDVAYLAPTSGSTGPPKIIMGSRLGLCHFIDAELSLVGRKPWRVSRLTPPTFDVMLRDLFVPLAAGGTLCLLPQFEDRLNPVALTRWLDDVKVELVHCVPTVLRMLGRQLADWNPSALQSILVAGEPLFATDVHPWLEKTSIRIVNVYGTSETTLAKFFHIVGVDDLRNQRIPVGRCIPGANAIVLNQERRPCPPGITGEIYIRTPYRSHGYLGQPELTAHRFVSNPLGQSANDLVDKTGDLGIVSSDGVFDILGRVDDVVKIRGSRVDLGIVETKLRSNPDVADCAVRALRNTDNDLYLCAYVEAVPGSVLDAAKLRHWLVGTLSGAMVPDVYQFMDAIPRNRRGKIDRSALPQPRSSSSQPRMPSSKTQEIVYEIWKSIVPAQFTFGIDDEFGLVGGQSIHAAQIAAQVQRRFNQRQLNLRTLLELSTVRNIASWIDQQANKDSSKNDQTLLADHPYQSPRFLNGRWAVNTPAEAPLSFAQRRFWRMLLQRDPDPSFHYLWLGEVKGEIDFERLSFSLTTVTTRHSATRTVLVPKRRGDNDPIQKTLPQDSVDFSLIRNSSYMTKTAALEAAREWSASAFDLQHKPPFRARIFEITNSHCILALAGHVLVSDGRSKDILLDELGFFYRSANSDSKPPHSFQRYACWERSAEAADLFAEKLFYWRSKLPERLDPPKLPYAAPAIDRPAQGEWLGVILGPEERHALARIAKQCRASEVSVLLGAFMRALEKWSHEVEIPVLIPNPNRLYASEQQVMGCFTETLLLYTTRAESAEQQVAAANQQILDSLDNAVPFDWLLEKQYPTQDTYNRDLFPVMFAPQPDLSASLALNGCQVQEIGGTADLKGSVFPIHVAPLVGEDTISISLGYDVRRFTSETARRLLDSLRSELDSFLEM